jgi:site-specific DNA-methyltransferase (adenine-specific)
MTEFDLRHEDCLEGMARIADGAIDLVVTSPPYNLGIAYNRYSDSQDRHGYLDWCNDWGTEVRRILKPTGSLFLNLGASPSNPFLPHELILRLRQRFALQNTIHWIKAITIEDDEGELISRGHFKPINSPRYLNDCHEYIFHLTPEGRTTIDRLALGFRMLTKVTLRAGTIQVGMIGDAGGNTWFIPYQTIMRRDKDRPHPATFPIELAENCIRLHGSRDDLVMLDPFLGIGNSALAAQECGWRSLLGLKSTTIISPKQSEELRLVVPEVHQSQTEPAAIAQRDNHGMGSGNVIKPPVTREMNTPAVPPANAHRIAPLNLINRDFLVDKPRPERRPTNFAVNRNR